MSTIRAQLLVLLAILAILTPVLPGRAQSGEPSVETPDLQGFRFFLRSVRGVYLPFMLESVEVDDPEEKGTWTFLVQDADGKTRRLHIGDQIGNTGFRITDVKVEVLQNVVSDKSWRRWIMSVKGKEGTFDLRQGEKMKSGMLVYDFYVVDRADLSERLAQIWEDGRLILTDSTGAEHHYRIEEGDVAMIRDKGRMTLQEIDAADQPVGRAIRVPYKSADDYNSYMKPYREQRAQD